MATKNNPGQKILCFSILFIAVFAVTNFHTFAFAEISLSSYDSIIGPTDRLLIMGTIEGDIQSFNPIKLVVYDPSGNIVYQPNVAIDGDGKFKYLITPTLPSFDDGQYVVEASQEDLKEKTQMYFTVSSDISDGLFDEDMETEIIPEFGTITMMILVVSIISILAITTKNKMMFKSSSI
ncbi:PEFG-CTERM sorting domain-containing protein [Nitrosopumilus sp. SJ]|uniref:PEFG-CTERM sorting domain-containing protein n=1 Tax=Nitrosopumilus sp. SJ TaxID=1027374 RepID=UPI0003750415|nr:PEFG-CTERM sorting domain-containing protein [Nitrosopumilus sp. SJ]